MLYRMKLLRRALLFPAFIMILMGSLVTASDVDNTCADRAGGGSDAAACTEANNEHNNDDGIIQYIYSIHYLPLFIMEVKLIGQVHSP